MKTNKLPPIQPGEILREEFMKPRGLSQNALARALSVPPRRINEIVLEKRGITADTALRLARYFGPSAEMWTGLQADYDLRLVRYQKVRYTRKEIHAHLSLTVENDFPFKMKAAMPCCPIAVTGVRISTISAEP